MYNVKKLCQLSCRNWTEAHLLPTRGGEIYGNWRHHEDKAYANTLVGRLLCIIYAPNRIARDGFFQTLQTPNCVVFLWWLSFSTLVLIDGVRSSNSGGWRFLDRPENNPISVVAILSMGSATGPLFSFGVISDVQYADIPDGHSFIGIPRYYRHSFHILQRAVQKWNHQAQKLLFAMNFGDIVDGKCPREQSLSSVEKVAGEFARFNGPVYHMIGNHCLYNLSRDKLLPLLKIPSVEGRAYYDFSPASGFRIVVLDGYDISAIGWPPDNANTLEALKFLQEKNPNSDKNSPEGLVGLERRFLMYNGAIGRQQLEWLDSTLQDATQKEQKVIVCCHLPLDPGASYAEALLWNYEEVMDVIHRYNCVKACLSGHDHKGGHSVDSHGIHHRSFEAALECPPGTDAFGYIDVYNDKLILLGTDRMQSTEMCFDP